MKKKFNINIIFLILMTISFIVYLIFSINNILDLEKNISKILEFTLLLALIIVFFCMSFKNNKKLPIIIGSIIITLYCIFNILVLKNIIVLPKDEYVPNFYNKYIEEVNEFKNKNNITINETYEYSDIIKENYVISQDVNYPTLLKDVKTINIIISKGIDYNKEVIVPNFIGLKYNDVIKYLEDNYLYNVEFNFIEKEDNTDIIIDQDGSGTRKRNDLIKLTVSINKDNYLEEIEDLTNKTSLYAINYLKKNGYNVKEEYEYNENYEKNKVIKVSEIIDNSITVTISLGKEIIVPDINSMSKEEINKWITDNNLKINYIEEYSDNISLGDIISSNKKEGDTIDSDETLEVILSLGNLKMIEIESIESFINWAENNNIDYQINYEYSNTLKKDEIISSSHKKNDLIKENDTIIVTVSKGKSITIPNFVGTQKSSIQTKCKEINLNCTFKYGGLTSNTKKDIATSQSKKKGTVVSEGTSLVITLSSGIVEKVTIPNFVGLTKTDITSKCKNIGITCNYTYQTSETVNKDVAIKQSKTGTINKGDSITITLSSGKASVCTIIVDANQLTSGNAEATKKTLETKLKKACPNVKFNFKYQAANSGIGYLAPNSEVKVGSNSLTNGKTYNVIINSN